MEKKILENVQLYWKLYLDFLFCFFIFISVNTTSLFFIWRHFFVKIILIQNCKSVKSDLFRWGIFSWTKFLTHFYLNLFLKFSTKEGAISCFALLSGEREGIRDWLVIDFVVVAAVFLLSLFCFVLFFCFFMRGEGSN